MLAGGTAAYALPWYAILVPPMLFAAGMTLFDTIDGLFMAHAYQWAFLRPSRKLFYSNTVTALSALVALSIGVTVLVQSTGRGVQRSYAEVAGQHRSPVRPIRPGCGLRPFVGWSMGTSSSWSGDGAVPKGEASG